MTIMLFLDILCWLELRLRWAYQTPKRQIADCFDKQPVPRFSCNDIIVENPRSQSAVDNVGVLMVDFNCLVSWRDDDGSST